MQVREHVLSGSPIGTERRITSFHYGPLGTGRKAYVQASLHADELPGMLVAHHLRGRLLALESEGRLQAEIVVVPVANPIGLAQSVLRSHVGRFDLASGENFNRRYPELLAAVRGHVAGRLGHDEAANAQLVRAALRAAVAGLTGAGELFSQRQTLLGLACDAEVVLDLHCDCEAVVHLYTGDALWPSVEALARLVGSEASLLASESGGDPFDEACSRTWWDLRAELGAAHPLPLGCLAVTLELRGEADVAHELAGRDATAITDWFKTLGLVSGPTPVLPPLRAEATPLAATDVVASPAAGLVVYRRGIGQRVAAGEPVADLVDPINGSVTPLASRVDGLLFARERQRYAEAGRSLFKVAGRVPVRRGKLTTE